MTRRQLVISNYGPRRRILHVVRVLSEKRRAVKLECGHQVLIESKSRKVARCHLCHTEKPAL